MDFPDGSDGKKRKKNLSANARDVGLISGPGKFPWRSKWQPTSIFLPRKIQWTEEPGGLQSMGLQRVGQDRSDWARTHSLMVSDCNSDCPHLTEAEVLRDHTAIPRELEITSRWTWSQVFAPLAFTCLCFFLPLSMILFWEIRFVPSSHII